MILPTLIPPGMDVCSVDFSEEGMDVRRFSVQKSMRVWWEWFMPCPCRAAYNLGGLSTEVDSPDPDCAGCGGSGALYDCGQPVAAQVTQARTDLEWYTALGPIAAGSAFFTLQSENVPNEMDRLTLLDGVHVFGERRTRETTVERPRYPIIPTAVTPGTQEDNSVPDPKTIGVLYLRGVDDDGILQPRLVEGTDFDIVRIGNTSGFAVDFTKGDVLGTAPPVGKSYTIRYFAHPVYVVQVRPFSRRALYQWNSGEPKLISHSSAAFGVLEYLAGNNSSTPADVAHPGVDPEGNAPPAQQLEGG